MRRKLINSFTIGCMSKSYSVQRFFSGSRLSPSWSQLSYRDKLSFAINTVPSTSEEAYLKAIGLLTGGPQLLEEVIDLLEQAISMSEGNYWPASTKLAEIWNELGKPDKAYDVLSVAVDNLHKAIKVNDNFKLDVIKQAIQNSESANKYIPISINDKEHNAEKLWLATCDLSQLYVKIGQKNKAVDLLFTAIEYLEYAIRVNNKTFDLLRDHLMIQKNSYDNLPIPNLANTHY